MAGRDQSATYLCGNLTQIAVPQATGQFFQRAAVQSQQLRQVGGPTIKRQTAFITKPPDKLRVLTRCVAAQAMVKVSNEQLNIARLLILDEQVDQRQGIRSTRTGSHYVSALGQQTMLFDPFANFGSNHRNFHIYGFATPNNFPCGACLFILSSKLQSCKSKFKNS